MLTDPKFLSTPSARRATAWCAGAVVRRNFYPRPPRGGRRSHYAQIESGDKFLSTPSARRATDSFTPELVYETISIHALREEGDRVHHLRGHDRVPISIHALREEGDVQRVVNRV